MKAYFSALTIAVLAIMSTVSIEHKINLFSKARSNHSNFGWWVCPKCGKMFSRPVEHECIQSDE